MQEIVPADAPRVPAVRSTKKKERLSRAVREAIRLLVSGECKTQKAAAERAGVTPVWLCMQLKKPAGQAFAARETRSNLAQGTMRAGARLLELIDASSEHVSLDAAKHTLAIEGIKPPDDSRNIAVSVGVSVGYVINLARGSAETRDHTGVTVEGSKSSNINGLDDTR